MLSYIDLPLVVYWCCQHTWCNGKLVVPNYSLMGTVMPIDPICIGSWNEVKIGPFDVLRPFKLILKQWSWNVLHLSCACFVDDTVYFGTILIYVCAVNFIVAWLWLFMIVPLFCFSRLLACAQAHLCYGSWPRMYSVWTPVTFVDHIAERHQQWRTWRSRRGSRAETVTAKKAICRWECVLCMGASSENSVLLAS